MGRVLGDGLIFGHAFRSMFRSSGRCYFIDREHKFSMNHSYNALDAIEQRVPSHRRWVIRRVFDPLDFEIRC